MSFRFKHRGSSVTVDKRPLALVSSHYSWQKAETYFLAWRAICHKPRVIGSRYGFEIAWLRISRQGCRRRI